MQMKKILAFILIAVCLLLVVGCETNVNVDPNKKSEGTMTYAEYIAAEVGSQVVIEAFVQGKQDYRQDLGKGTVYLQDGNGGYLAYRIKCTEAEYKKIEIGSKIKVTGTKDVWKGLVELKEDCTFEIVGNDTWVAEATDITSLLGTDELINKQNMKVSFKGMKIEEKVDNNGNKCAFFYNWDNSGESDPYADLYFDVSVNGKTYTCVIESSLCNSDSDVYKAVQALKVGDIVDMEGFLYWYEGPQPHITNITVK